MLAALLMTLAGLALLVLAGDALVRGAVNLALRAGVPALLVSLTIVAFGTSAPELLVVIKAAAEGYPGVAIGNIVGSNIANILLVVGVPALISGIVMDGESAFRNYVFMMGASIAFIALAWLGPLDIPHGVVLLALLGLMLFDAWRSARRHRRAHKAARAAQAAAAAEAGEIEEVDPGLPGWKIALLLVIGIIGLPLGADLLVKGAVDLAEDLGVSDTVIGLTVVAVGTSLPELATTVAAALRRHTDVILGNVLGSNAFNLLAIMGLGSLFGPLEMPRRVLDFDLWVMLGTALLLAPFIILRLNISRAVGAIMLALYALYVAQLV